MNSRALVTCVCTRCTCASVRCRALSPTRCVFRSTSPPTARPSQAPRSRLKKYRTAASCSCAAWRSSTVNPRIVEVRKHILKKNDELARALRERFRAFDVFVVSLVSSPGAGKTALLERTLAETRDRWRVAALVGDLQTDNDARRLAASGAPVRQITTGTVCHLDAEMVSAAL